MTHALGSGLRGWGLLAAVGLLACGKAADGDNGADGKSVTDRQHQEAELAALDDGAELIAADVGAPAPAAECDSSKTCRGGLLAGTWEVVANCTSQLQPRRTLQTFGKPFLALDSDACASAVQLDTSGAAASSSLRAFSQISARAPITSSSLSRRAV
jgi:hypothetical protein